MQTECSGQMRKRVSVPRLQALALAHTLLFATLAATTGHANDGEVGGVLLVANADDVRGREAEGYITVFDAAGQKLGTIPNGGVMAHELIVTNDGRYVFAPIYGTGAAGGPGEDGSTISVIDIGMRKVVSHIDLGHGARPHHGVVGSDGLLYITTELDNTVIVVDPDSRRVVASIPTGQPVSHNVTVSRDGKRAYTSNVFAGTVSVLDVPGRKLLQIIRVTPAEKPQTGKRDDWGVQRIEISNDDRDVYTCDWNSSELVAIDTTTNSIRHRTKLVSPCYGFASTPDGRWLLASNVGAAKVTVINTKTLEVARVIDVPKGPQAILIRPDAKVAYVSCGTDKAIAVINLIEWNVEKTIPTGNWPDGLGWGGVDLRALHTTK
jgi:YVTN family beta-propeller protein